MKKFFKILFFSFIILGFFIVSFLPLSSVSAISYTPQVTIPGGPSGDVDGSTLGKYIIAIYKYGIGIVGILAAIVMMFGGFRWLTSMGSQEAVNDAKAWITASLTGLVIALCSFLILATVNTNLTEFKTLDIKTVDTMSSNSNDLLLGCCLGLTGNTINNIKYSYCANTTKDACKYPDTFLANSSYTVIFTANSKCSENKNELDNYTCIINK